MPDPPEPEDHPFTQITIVTSESTKPRATAHTRSWEMPADGADFVAAWLKEIFGPPVEGLCPVGSMIDLAEMKGHMWVSGGEDDGG